MAEKGFTADAIEMIGWTFLGMFLLILFPNMIYAFILKRFGYGHRKLFFWNMLIPFLVIFDYLLLLPSTMYGVSGLRSLSKTGKASKAGIMINGICQFLFVFDVISAAYLYIRFRKSY
ncbi:hypothetical protein [Mediterraneibacter glycyrrhizinilyticus]|uniref:Uncharacterized protein n=1 Tax=Candidatus Mediterraneibacter faecipullorum TaxID=2838670 RepID=A0A9D2NLK4_9FIRM|nr:hypothetical protein [Mediterraneibacter glycyrrhizinilyticus]MDM8209949.1 hypothetical protein [Mediterraneibacter glycyrrhizinilyticus]HJC33626.1 hypothetical protein [Candidatus Mediterraneibacter faecipullorum]